MEELNEKLLDEVVGGVDAHEHNVMDAIGGQGTEGIPRNPNEENVVGTPVIVVK